jgi:hypothetical protein
MTAFRCIGGSLLWGSDHELSEDDARWLIKLFATEWRAAVRAQDEEATTRAATLHAELNTAWAKAKDWARAGGMVR